MKVYTKTGDSGETSLFKGARVSKDHPIIIALGSIDELTSYLGKIKSQMTQPKVWEELNGIQQKLIVLMGMIAGYESRDNYMDERDTEDLETAIDYYESMSHEFKAFILPGKSPLSADIDIARTVARRAERELTKCEDVVPLVKKYINRLSDYLFMLARYIEENKSPISKELNLDSANHIIDFVRQEAIKQGLNVVIAIVTKAGRPISVQSMDEAFVISYELAIKKAFTASALQMGTHELAQLVAKGADFEGLAGMLDEKIITLGGGCPIKINNKVIGAIGVSGGNASQDIELAKLGANLFERG
ncbi:MAG: cob(I)yrinic acid a,c-diamide adenosyltransferase [Cellulosilyticaceae bacterium]